MKWGQKGASEECRPRVKKNKRREQGSPRVEVTGKEEDREKYRDSKNIAADTRRKGAPRTRDGKEEGREKRCGTDL